MCMCTTRLVMAPTQPPRNEAPGALGTGGKRHTAQGDSRVRAPGHCRRTNHGLRALARRTAHRGGGTGAAHIEETCCGRKHASSASHHRAGTIIGAAPREDRAHITRLDNVRLAPTIAAVPCHHSRAAARHENKAAGCANPTECADSHFQKHGETFRLSPKLEAS